MTQDAAQWAETHQDELHILKKTAE